MNRLIQFNFALLKNIYIRKGSKMKKIISLALVCVMLMGCVFALASCGNISESYAEKINKAAEKGEHYSYADVKDDLGDNAIDITIGVGDSFKSGVIVAVKGCETVEDVQAKIDEGKTVKGIVVGIALGKATSAAYKEITEDDLK